MLPVVKHIRMALAGARNERERFALVADPRDPRNYVTCNPSSKFQVPNYKLQVTQFQVPSAKSKSHYLVFQVPSSTIPSNFRVPSSTIPNSKFQVPQFQVPYSKFQVPTSKFQVPSPTSKFQVQVPTSKFRFPSSNLPSNRSPGSHGAREARTRCQLPLRYGGGPSPGLCEAPI